MWDHHQYGYNKQSCTACFDHQNRCVLSTHWIYSFVVFVRINTSNDHGKTVTGNHILLNAWIWRRLYWAYISSSYSMTPPKAVQLWYTYMETEFNPALLLSLFSCDQNSLYTRISLQYKYYLQLILITSTLPNNFRSKNVTVLRVHFMRKQPTWPKVRYDYHLWYHKYWDISRYLSLRRSNFL